MGRKPISVIETFHGFLIAVCDDGTMWRKIYSDTVWVRIEDIPQDAPQPKPVRIGWFIEVSNAGTGTSYVADPSLLRMLSIKRRDAYIFNDRNDASMVARAYAHQYSKRTMQVKEARE